MTVEEICKEIESIESISDLNIIKDNIDKAIVKFIQNDKSDNLTFVQNNIVYANKTLDFCNDVGENLFAYIESTDPYRESTVDFSDVLYEILNNYNKTVTYDDLDTFHKGVIDDIADCVRSSFGAVIWDW